MRRGLSPRRAVAGTTVAYLALGSLFASATNASADTHPASADGSSTLPPLPPPSSSSSASHPKQAPTLLPDSYVMRPMYIDDWPKSRPPPPGYRWVTRPPGWAVGLASGGMLFVWLVPAIISTAIYDHEANNGRAPSFPWLVLPVAGPFIALAGEPIAPFRTVLWVDGAVQVALTCLGVGAVVLPQTRLTRDDYALLRVAPMLTRDAAGVAIVGGF